MLLGLLVLSFLIFRIIPGDPIYASGGTIPGYLVEEEPTIREELAEFWGLGLPLHLEFLVYIRNLLTFNFGNSFTAGYHPVIEVLYSRVTYSLLLCGVALAITAGLGLGISAVKAAKRGGKLDTGILVGVFTFRSIPIPFLGLILIFVFGSFIPNAYSGTVTTLPDPVAIRAFWSQLILASIALALFCLGNLVLMLRNRTLAAMTQNRIEVARAQGMDEEVILSKYGVLDSGPSFAALVTLFLGSVISGMILTETVFRLNGLGSLFFSSIMQQNYGVLQALFYVLALSMIITYFLASVVEGALNIRQRTHAK
jgi:peptide/nickel transport system permease protein